MTDRLIVPMYCAGCGAPLNGSLKCEYCGVGHERVERYRGPEVPRVIEPGSMAYYATSTAAAYTIYPGSYALNPNGEWQWYSD